jgi:hypothetical protein
VLDFEPETTGQPIVAGQPPPPLEETFHLPVAAASPGPARGGRRHDPVPADSHLPEGTQAPERF